MKPSRFEWRDQERQRVAREGTGARYLSYVYAQHLKRFGGIMLAMLPIGFIMQALAQTPDDPVEPRAAHLTGLVLVVFSGVALRWFKPTGPMTKWALWTTFGMGCLIPLMELLI